MSFEQRAGVAEKLENLVGCHASIKHERCRCNNREKAFALRRRSFAHGGGLHDARPLRLVFQAEQHLAGLGREVHAGVFKAEELPVVCRLAALCLL